MRDFSVSLSHDLPTLSLSRSLSISHSLSVFSQSIILSINQSIHRMVEESIKYVILIVDISTLPEEGQKWGLFICLLFSYDGLLCIACMSIRGWLKRRRAHLLRAQQGIPVSKYGVLVDMIHVSDWAFEAAGQEMRGMGQDAAYQPGLYLTATHVSIK
ncbi:E3 ubiquitin-protein ligase SIS3-like isoform X1 [Camellia sinensis]|uniref:E3 ubiquitin-protein ligase SIS3-like isoform X1 n=1 Tax=Camellia sinensis TaxID=4442 RepID=UPI00103633C1|nr:E3 ubiquitin-protein ligase SIS3-like isoform X1 [Camellia sinensis]